MIQHVHERAARSGAERVIVATDDPRIARVCKDFGAQVCLTRADHASGTERLAEVIESIGMDDACIVVNVQGDEPFIAPSNIAQVAGNLASRAVPVATLCEPIVDYSLEATDPNIVKVVRDARGYALYFSRAPIPWPRDGVDSVADSCRWQRHVGIYAYRAGFLATYVGWDPSPLEKVEALEQLRVLWYGERIHVDEAVVASPPGIDTPEDLKRARAYLESGGLEQG